MLEIQIKSHIQLIESVAPKLSKHFKERWELILEREEAIRKIGKISAESAAKLLGYKIGSMYTVANTVLKPKGYLLEGYDFLEVQFLADWKEQHKNFKNLPEKCFSNKNGVNFTQDQISHHEIK